MSIPRSEFPKPRIMKFCGIVIFSNLLAIILIVIWYIFYPERFSVNPVIVLVVVLAINIASMLMLLPLRSMDPIRPFLKSAWIWFIAVSIAYVILSAYVLLMPAVIQMFGDLWFNSFLTKKES